MVALNYLITQEVMFVYISARWKVWREEREREEREKEKEKTIRNSLYFLGLI